MENYRANYGDLMKEQTKQWFKKHPDYMKNAKHSIFRADAVRRYIEGREKSVLPRFVSPRIFIGLWFLLGLLIICGFVAWFAKVPVYASGPAVVVDWKDRPQYIRDDVLVIAFLPPDNLSRLRVGQTMFLNTARERLNISIISVEPDIISPDDAQRRFALSGGTAEAITRPAAVAVAPLEPTPSSLPISTYRGCVYSVDIEVGSRRVISLLPLIGQFFDG